MVTRRSGILMGKSKTKLLAIYEIENNWTAFFPSLVGYLFVLCLWDTVLGLLI